MSTAMNSYVNSKWTQQESNHRQAIQTSDGQYKCVKAETKTNCIAFTFTSEEQTRKYEQREEKKQKK